MKISEQEITRADEIISLIQDYKDGKRIQQRKRTGKQWTNLEPGEMPKWDFERYEYRSCPDTVPCCVSVNLDYELKERLDAIAAAENTTINALYKDQVLELIENFIRSRSARDLFEAAGA